MSRIVIYFEDRGRFVNRDASWYRVAIYRGGVYLGCWNGVVSGAVSIGIASLLEANELQRAAVAATAMKLQEAAYTSGLREEWLEEVPQIPLGVRDLVEARTERNRDFGTGEPVLTFELDGQESVDHPVDGGNSA